MPATDNLISTATIIWNYLKSQSMTNLQFEMGMAAIPSLLLNSSTTLAVPLSGTFPDTNYVVKSLAIAGTAVLSTLQVTSVTKSVSSLSITVKANGLATVAGVLIVNAYRNA